MGMFIYGLGLKPRRREPMQVPVYAVTITEKEGIRGDHRGKNKDRQVALISIQQWREACDELHINAPWWTRRACVSVYGHLFGPNDIRKLIYFERGVVLQVTMETQLCPRMDEVHPGLVGALANWRGGVCTSVICGGTLTQDEKFTIL